MSGQGSSPEQEFLARLEGVTTDISGLGRVRMGDFPGRMPLSRYRELAASRGWELAGAEHSGSELVLQVKRRGTASVKRRPGPEFLTGPGLAELRGSEVARQEAARVLRETGVDVLSEEVLDAARRRHLALRRRVVRLAWLCAAPGLFALTGLLVSFILWGDGDVHAGNGLAVASAVAAVAFAALLALPVRAERARKATIGGYATAYERVVSAALAAQHRSHD